MFVDASAIVAILTRESDADALADALEAAVAPVTSRIAVFEAVLGICLKRHASVEEAGADVQAFLDASGVSVLPITSAETDIALVAFSRYGKGRRHPAQFNLGDCFAYAMAKSHRMPLLFKGDDFTQTDIAAEAGRG
jgi:ribonuclease VapC